MIDLALQFKNTMQSCDSDSERAAAFCHFEGAGHVSRVVGGIKQGGNKDHPDTVVIFFTDASAVAIAENSAHCVPPLTIAKLIRDLINE